ncbi:MAG: hypothetical protein RR614_14590, partial [Eubacterium sp.]
MKRKIFLLLLISVLLYTLSGCTLSDKLTQTLLPKVFDGVLYEVGDHTITLLMQSPSSENTNTSSPLYVTLDTSTIPDYEAPDLYSSLRIITASQADVNTINTALSPEGSAKTPEDALKNTIPIKKAALLNPASVETMAQVMNAKLISCVQAMTLEEKIGQLFFARYPGPGADQVQIQYQFGGYILFGRDFQDKNADQIKAEINGLQQ